MVAGLMHEALVARAMVHALARVVDAYRIRCRAVAGGASRHRFACRGCNRIAASSASAPVIAPIRAPAAGVVKAIHAAVGKPVEKGTV